MCEQNSKSIGVWMSDKKSQKMNWKELAKACMSRGYTLLKLDLNRPLNEQGKIDVFLHKLTDVIAAADQGDFKASCIIKRVEQYLSNHPSITVIDSLDKVRILLNRNHYYGILDAEPTFRQSGIFTPAYAEFTTSNVNENLSIMRWRGVKFPVICKPTIAHGSKSAHEMIVIFNEKGLRVCKPPCVVQSFVNHNAVLHKVFLIGNRYHIVERPSLKNFYPSENLNPIFYSTGEVCKADSQSTLSILDPHDQSQTDIKMTLDETKIKHIIKVLKKEIGLLLAGFDVVIDNGNGYHAVIDINVFPSYDNFPNFFDHLLDCVDEMLDNKKFSLCNETVDMNKLLSMNCGKSNGLINVNTCTKKVNVIGMNI